MEIIRPQVIFLGKKNLMLNVFTSKNVCSPMTPKKFKSIFISDIHLGTKGCQAELLIDFLKNNTAKELYLVGDIVDGWRMSRGIYWPNSHSEVIRQILKHSKNNTKIRYITGNHDEALRKWTNWHLRFGRIRITNSRDYTSVEGKRYLVTHGDMFDNLMRKDLKWIMHVGDVAYNLLIWLNTKLNWFRKRLGMKYWSLSRFLKDKTKQAVSFMEGFEIQLADYAKKKNYDGVICGHIHSAKNKMIGDIHYINTGDWVESCTAIVETHDGEWQLIDWSEYINSK